MDTGTPSNTAASVGELIRGYRMRLDPNLRRLGDFVRETQRVGCLVSEAEIAEAVEVSRQWYVTLERCPRISVPSWILARLAHVLMLDPKERMILYCLAAGSQDDDSTASF